MWGLHTIEQYSSGNEQGPWRQKLLSHGPDESQNPIGFGSNLIDMICPSKILRKLNS